MTLAAPVFAHEGHVHATGIGNIVTTATVTGPEAHQFVTVPGWGALPRGGDIGPLHGDLAVVTSGNVYVSMESNAGVAVFDKHGRFTKTLKPGLQQFHSLTAVEENGKEFLWGAQYQANRAVKFELEGNIASTLPNEKTGKLEGGMEGLSEVLVGPKGHLFFFMGYGSKKIHKLKPDGSLVKTYGGGGPGKDQMLMCRATTQRSPKSKDVSFSWTKRERSSRLYWIIRTRGNGGSILCLPISYVTVGFPLLMGSSGDPGGRFTFLNTAR